ncbi:hypothetical protein Tco_1139602, partial [Tanacetum coccineum]
MISPTTPHASGDTSRLIKSDESSSDESNEDGSDGE